MGLVMEEGRVCDLECLQITGSLDAAMRCPYLPLTSMVPDALCAQWQVQPTDLEVL